MIRLLPTFAAAAVLVMACGGSIDGPLAGADSTPSPRPRASEAAVATLPDSGAMVRLVNLYADESGGQTVDVYGFAGSDIESEQVLVATLEYGLGNWYMVHGDTAKARAAFTRSVKSGGWPAFGFIASEAELRRLGLAGAR